MENKNTIIPNKNITVVSVPKVDIVKNYQYERKDGDTLVFCDSVGEAVNLFQEEGYDKVAATVFGGRFPASMVEEKKDGYDYFFIGGRTKTNGKFFIYPDKTATKDYL